MIRKGVAKDSHTAHIPVADVAPRGRRRGRVLDPVYGRGQDEKGKDKEGTIKGCSNKRGSKSMEYWLPWYMDAMAHKDDACGGRMGLIDTPSLWIHVPHEACLNEISVSGHASAVQAVL